MHDSPAKIQWTGTRTITAAGNRTCIITLRLRDFKSQTSLTLLLRQYELTNKNVSYFLTNQSKTKTFIDLKVTRNPKPTKNSTWPYLNGIPAILFMRSRQKTGVTGPSPTTNNAENKDSLCTKHCTSLLLWSVCYIIPANSSGLPGSLQVFNQIFRSPS